VSPPDRQPYRRDLELFDGAAQAPIFTFRDLVGTPLVLSAYGARAMIRGAYSDLNPLLVLGMGSGIAVVTDPTTSTLSALQVTITGAQATSVVRSGIGRGVWDVWLDPNGTPDAASFMAIKGAVAIGLTATR
jgi:hypothetical protein